VSEHARSIAFDRAAEQYDQTRVLSPEAKAQVEELLTDELRGRGSVLEIGVGTGRIALPLAGAGIPTVGLDLSQPMLEKLIEKAGGRRPFPLIRGDATALPFADDSFGAAYGVHVLHLIPDWEGVVAELARVVRSGGVVLIDLGAPSSELDELNERLAAEAGGSYEHPGLQGQQAERRLDDEFARQGGVVRELEPIPEEWRMPAGTFIELFANGVYSWTWTMPEDKRRRAAEAVRPWAAERFGPLDQPIAVDRTIRWRAYDLPGPAP
jgi:SAM-dependent methyltransferase